MIQDNFRFVDFSNDGCSKRNIILSLSSLFDHYIKIKDHIKTQRKI